jgi:hypothetical protein
MMIPFPKSGNATKERWTPVFIFEGAQISVNPAIRRTTSFQ